MPPHRPNTRLPRAGLVRARLLRAVGPAALVTGLATAMAVLTVPGQPAPFASGTGPARLEAAATTYPVADDAPTRLRVSSFNLLGYGHTQPGGGHPKYTDGLTRMNWAVQIIRKNNLQVIGVQEMQSPQYARFRELTGSEYGVYPGNKLTTAAMANSIIWLKSKWRLVDAETVQIPYFHGNLIRMPYILLENRLTGRRAWFFNSHNPADAHGPAQRWRNKAVAIEKALFNQLQADYPTTPVISTGDENDRDQYFCPMVLGTRMRASNGGGVRDSACVMPDAPTHVDWVMGSDPLVQFTSHAALRGKLVRRTTDHYVIVANAVLPAEAVVDADITHAVVVTVDGLTSRGLGRAVAHGDAPRMAGMISGGASTLNARTAAESTGGLANLAGVLTGRPVDPAQGGTGLGWHGASPGGPLMATAGHYVSGVFDVVHDRGKNTAFYGHRGDADLLASSWNAANGAADPYGLDNGSNKIGRYVRSDRDADTVSALASQLATGPAKLMVAQLVRPHAVGKEYGFRSDEYAAVLKATDRLIGRVQKAIRDNPKLRGHTLLVVTANRGGSLKNAAPRTVPGVYTVPLLVTGPGVLAGGDLYAMNPAYVDPGTRNPDDTTGHPIRNALVANLVTKMLGLPPVPGSRLDRKQTLTVLTPPVG